MPWWEPEELHRIEYGREPPEAGDMQRRSGRGQKVKGRPKVRKMLIAHLSADSAEQFDRLKRERDEALEQLAATSDVLQVISRSPGELEPVFNAMLANATRICEAAFGVLLVCEGTVFRSAAIHSKKGHADSWQRNPVLDLRANPGIPLDHVAKTKQVVHIADLRTHQSYIGKNDHIVTLVEVAGARTHVTVPMLKEGELIGAISMGA
jgi:hypothetical protein